MHFSSAFPTQLTDDINASFLTRQKRFKVVVVSLAAGVFEDLTRSRDGVVPVATRAVCAVADAQRLRADRF